MNGERCNSERTASRRELLRAGAAVVAAGAALPFAAAAGGRALGRETVRVGLVGCGGRGTGAAVNALRADPRAVLVAMADTFEDQLAASLGALGGVEDVAERVRVEPEQRFVGFDGYQGVIAAADVVLLATPPHFRPRHVAAAVEAGRHLFVEKPVATDAPGLRSVLASCEAARAQRLSVVSGFCHRHERAKRETIARIHGGAIGEIVALQTTYHTSGLWHRGRRESWSDVEWQLRNWLYFTWLSGDHVVEQHVHGLDKIAWVMGDEPPAKVTASGGRAVRTEPEYGDVYDHFSSVFEWPSGVRCFASCRQWNGAAGDVSDHVFGTQGTARLQSHAIEGAEPWRWRSEEPDDMYQNEHDALFAAIRADEPLNDGRSMCQSTLMAIMARMSAYTGQTITWEQALASEEDLSPPAYEWGPLEVRPLPRPGITRFA